MTYGDFEKRVVGDLYDLDRVGDVLNAAETAFLECMQAARGQRRNNMR